MSMRILNQCIRNIECSWVQCLLEGWWQWSREVNTPAMWEWESAPWLGGQSSVPWRRVRPSEHQEPWSGSEAVRWDTTCKGPVHHQTGEREKRSGVWMS